MSCYQLLARYYLNIAPYKLPADLTKEDLPDRSEDREKMPIEEAAEAYIQMKRGNLNKTRANKVFHGDKQKYKEYMYLAESFYNQALSLATKLLGDHQLTCALYKLLGDLFFNRHKNGKALAYNKSAINLHKKLKFDSNEHYVTLLKNCGTC